MKSVRPTWSMICSSCGETHSASKPGLGKERQREAERAAAEHLARNPGHSVHVGYTLDYRLVFGDSLVDRF